jgi:hypothetical protein
VITVHGLVVHCGAKMQNAISSVVEAKAVACAFGTARAEGINNALIEIHEAWGLTPPPNADAPDPHRLDLPMLNMILYGAKIDTKHINLKAKALKDEIKDGADIHYVPGTIWAIWRQ